MKDLQFKSSVSWRVVLAFASPRSLRKTIAAASGDVYLTGAYFPRDESDIETRQDQEPCIQDLVL